MSVTNFAALTPQQKIVWSRDLWSAARDKMFTKRFVGKGDSAMIQRITDLTKTEKGEKVLMQLVADLVEDGVVGDNQREGNEESMQSYSQEIQIDLLSHQVRNKGKLAEQKTVIKFREQGRDKLAYWLANRIDQLVFLTLSGVSYAFRNDGSPRGNSPFPNLSFAADVGPLTNARHLMWNGTSLVPSDTTVIDSTYLVSYKMIVDLIAYAKDHYVKPLTDGGKEYFVLLVKPGTLAQLKKDPDYQRAVIHGQARGPANPWFTGATVTIDGAVIHEHRLVYSTTGAVSGSKWGSGGTVNGSRTLLCGAQALGMADLGPPEWDEEYFDYKTKQGISIDKMFGLLRPAFYSIYDKSVQDFGAIGIDHYLQ
ncbi:MAG: N4-gp56 family major capsid protein [Pseudomonadota bacterium]